MFNSYISGAIRFEWLATWATSRIGSSSCGVESPATAS